MVSNIQMKNGYTKNQNIESISLNENNNTFFNNFILKGMNSNMLGVEEFPGIINAAGLCICTEGNCNITIGSKNYSIKKNDMCIIFPNNILQIKNKSKDFNGYTIACSTEFFSQATIHLRAGTKLYLTIKENPCMALENEEKLYLIKMLNFLKEHQERKENPYHNEISKLLVSSIIYEVVGIYKLKKPMEEQPYSRKDKIFLDFMNLVVKNHKTNRNINFYAGKLCISPRHLLSICKEVSGKTTKEYINIHIINSIYILLNTTDMTISQIAEELNFPNASFFTRFFKKQTGITPNKYRSMNK